MRVVTAKELGKILAVAVRTIWRYDEEGKIPRPLRIGRSVRWRLNEIQDWLNCGAPRREVWEARRN
jgi:predicted DNA-binding transcriptional regulator AlpA